MTPSNPKVLRKLKIDEFSLVDVPASEGSDVLIWKGHTMQQTQRTNELAAEAMRLTKSGNRENIEKAGQILEDPAVYEAFREADARAAEEARSRPPVAVGKRGGAAVDDLIAKANALREANPGLTMAAAMDRIAAQDLVLAKRVDQELTAA